MPENTQEITVSDVLFHQVYVPEFVKQAAAAGLEINTQEDLQHALAIAESLRSVKEAQGLPLDSPIEQLHQEAQDSLIKQAALGLGEALRGESTDVDQYLADPYVEQAFDTIDAAAPAA